MAKKPAKPTELAEMYFGMSTRMARETLGFIQGQKEPMYQLIYDVVAVQFEMSRGLGELAIGVRAIYNLLEEVKQRLPPAGAGVTVTPRR